MNIKFHEVVNGLNGNDNIIISKRLHHLLWNSNPCSLELMIFLHFGYLLIMLSSIIFNNFLVVTIVFNHKCSECKSVI